MEPVMTLLVDGTRTPVDSVIDINLHGARVRFAEQSALHLRPGQKVTVTLQAPGLDGCVDIESSIVFSAVKESRIVVALKFISEPDLGDRTDGNFFSIFNRREQRREVGVAALRAMLVANREAPDNLGDIEVKVINHSKRGIGFVVDRTLDDLLRGREVVDLKIHTQAEVNPLPQSARILHRVLRSDTIYYGCMFAA